MHLVILVWVTVVALQSALLGRNVYVIICLTDLESDFLNPFDLSTRVNKWVVAEYGVQAALTAVLLLSGNWLSGLLNLIVLAYLVHLWSKRCIFVDTTEAFRQLPQQKRQRFTLLATSLFLFVLAVFRLVEAAIHTLLTPEGRELTQKLLHEAAASIHGY